MSSSMSSYSLPLVLLTVLTVLSLSTSVHAFGAGDIPDFSFLNDRAFRHGDIENVIKDLVKVAGTSGGMYGFAQSIMNSSGGKKFSSEDVKRIYFGNWLRDYSQCMDIGGLSKLTADTLVLVVSVLGFLEFGFATEEYEVTPERLGVYLPVEHIDNPKGYAAVEGDARQFHPLLRPPVDPRELEVDHRTGMKNYMATEDGGWDTSTLYIRRSLRTAIELGRRSGLEDGPETNEAFRLMGQALHTLEDLLAHSNWCEVGLRLLGFQDVFCHVGDQVLVDTPRGPAPPLVTGTFTIRDLVHSLLGEAADHLSQTSVVGLTHRLEEASANDTGESLGGLRGVLEKVLGGGSGDAKTNEAAEIEQQSKAYHFDPENVASPEVVKQLHDILIWRDGVMRDIQAKISMIPGLESLMENMSNGINTYIYTLLAPYLTPVLTQVTGVLHDRSQEVIEHEDQYEVFNDPYASDPTHSVMSKDHFGLILNEPAGKIARHVVTFAVNAITAAWADTELDPDSIITTILEAFHHPYYSTGESAVQNAMMHELQDWINGMDPDAQQQTIAGLTKDAVRNGLNKRLSEEEEQEVMRQQEATEHAPQPTDFSSLEEALGGILGGGVAGFAAGALLGGGGGDGEYEEREPDYGGADEDAGAAWRGGGGDEYQQEGQQEEQQFEIPEEVGDAIGSVVEDLW